LAFHIIRKASNDFCPERPECPTPTAHRVVEVVKCKKHGKPVELIK